MQIDRPIAIAIILFIAVLLGFFLVLPQYNNFKALRMDFAEKEAEYNAKFDYYSAISKAYFDLQSRQEDLKKIDSALPEDADMGQIVYNLQKIAQGNGMLIKNLFLSKSSQAGKTGVKDIIFSMDLLGDYPSLGSFISALEESARIFEVVSISFGSPNQLPAGTQTQFQMQQNYVFNVQIKTHAY